MIHNFKNKICREKFNISRPFPNLIRKNLPSGYFSPFPQSIVLISVEFFFGVNYSNDMESSGRAPRHLSPKVMPRFAIDPAFHRTVPTNNRHERSSETAASFISCNLLDIISCCFSSKELQGAVRQTGNYLI